MENIRKRCNVYLETDPDHFLRQTAKPSISCKIFSENLVAANMKGKERKERLKLNKPSYVGMCILDLSKVLMYDFHYNYIKRKYNERAKLLFTDTDSLCYLITTDDAYRDFYHDRELFDNSDYAKSSKFFFDENKKVIGKFKDETARKPIIEFVGIKSKTYSYKTETKNNKTAKGIKKNIIKRDIDHSDYQNTLFGSGIMHHKMKTIRSEYHQIASYQLNKISLSFLMISVIFSMMVSRVMLMEIARHAFKKNRNKIIMSQINDISYLSSLIDIENKPIRIELKKKKLEKNISLQ